MKKLDIHRYFGSDAMAKVVFFTIFENFLITLFRHETFGDSYLYEYLAGLPEV